MSWGVVVRGCEDDSDSMLHQTVEAPGANPGLTPNADHAHEILSVGIDDLTVLNGQLSCVGKGSSLATAAEEASWLPCVAEAYETLGNYPFCVPGL